MTSRSIAAAAAAAAAVEAVAAELTHHQQQGLLNAVEKFDAEPGDLEALLRLKKNYGTRTDSGRAGKIISKLGTIKLNEFASLGLFYAAFVRLINLLKPTFGCFIPVDLQRSWFLKAVHPGSAPSLFDPFYPVLTTLKQDNDIVNTMYTAMKNFADTNSVAIDRNHYTDGVTATTTKATIEHHTYRNLAELDVSDLAHKVCTLMADRRSRALHDDDLPPPTLRVGCDSMYVCALLRSHGCAKFTRRVHDQIGFLRSAIENHDICVYYTPEDV